MKALAPLVAGVLAAAAASVGAQTGPTASDTVLPAVAPDTPEVVVEQPEPRFVAPTRRDRIGRVWAPVMIDGKGPFRLVLDTGSDSSAIIPRVAESLGATPASTRRVTLHGVTGTAVVPTIPVRMLEFGELRVTPRRIPIVADVFGGAEGVLGNNGLTDKRIHIDFARDAIRISRSRGERVESGFTRIPVDLERNRILTAVASVGGIRTRAVIDTGAQLSIGNLALREALLRRPRKEEGMQIIGVTLDVAHGKSLPAPPIELGALRIYGLSLTFSDVFIFDYWKLTREPAMLIGMDVLGTLDTLVIDYRMRELQVRQRRH